ncbi:recombinase family protein [Bradyrhizobium sp. Leo170]|uniref:recombinase family protein n=1 Tax=Bradyrhizobium sp. Leo170 TaxID=1571199 RepID=UPI00102E604A|nr:recombinase family protein [Bradyrhizobium sp. Leo170]TAI60371.1 recombinase family protein [Bradyrhizobium sp. Leo170]
MINALVPRRNTHLANVQRRLLAAQYVRMSTDKQSYSIQNQAAAIAAYAHAHSLTIVRTYSDEGESGLKITNRAGLTSLIEDVRSGQPDFDHLLVYDVSRWGRFQDIDESAHYEFLCKQAGIKVVYCAEQFDNDGSLLSSIIKNLKRVMAAEYSRELSAKVLDGACRLSRLGFRVGGRPGYGLRRDLVDESGHSRGLLQAGERKYLQTDHVVLRPGPPDEQEVVREIFRRFAIEKWPEVKIVRQLNKDGVLTLDGRPWTTSVMHYLLQNESYIGNIVYNRKTFHLGQPQKLNPPELWIRSEGALPQIVEPALFWRARQRIRDHYNRLSSEEMLKRLRLLLRKRGKLTAQIIDESAGLPCSSDYQLRFGSIRKAYKLIGYEATLDCSYLETREACADMVVKLRGQVIDALEGANCRSILNEHGTLIVNEGIAVSFRTARYWRPKGRKPIWTVRHGARLPDGFILVIRLDETNRASLDYFLLPTGKVARRKICFSEKGCSRYRNHQFLLARQAVETVVSQASKHRTRPSGSA